MNPQTSGFCFLEMIVVALTTLWNYAGYHVDCNHGSAMTSYLCRLIDAMVLHSLLVVDPGIVLNHSRLFVHAVTVTAFCGRPGRRPRECGPRANTWLQGFAFRNATAMNTIRERHVFNHAGGENINDEQAKSEVLQGKPMAPQRKPMARQ